MHLAQEIKCLKCSIRFVFSTHAKYENKSGMQEFVTSSMILSLLTIRNPFLTKKKNAPFYLLITNLYGREIGNTQRARSGLFLLQARI